MATTPNNHRAEWTNADETLLKLLAKHNTPTRVIGLKMGRSEADVKSKAGMLVLSLKPTNQSSDG